jgi:hypothetical protein
MEEFSALLASWRLRTKVLEVWQLCADKQDLSNFTGRLCTSAVSVYQVVFSPPSGPQSAWGRGYLQLYCTSVIPV